MPITHLLLDLDGTLYPHNNGLWDQIAARMERYMGDTLNIPASQIPSLRQKYYQEYGTTLGGFRDNYTIDAEDFLNYVHEIELAPFLSTNPDLRKVLTSLTMPIWIFTNSHARHSTNVMRTLGIEDLVEGIIDVIAVNYHGKPHIQAYRTALQAIGSPDPASCLFVDDIPKNLAAAKSFGIRTVLIGSDDASRGIDHQIPDICQLPEIVRKIELEL